MVIKSALYRARGSVRVQEQLTRVRKVRNRLVDAPLRQVEYARRQLVEGDVDVLLLGDSSTLSWSPRDQDRTLLPAMLEPRLGKVANLVGPGFGANIFSETIRILATLDQRPKAVVMTLALRTATSTHICDHPIVGYPRSVAALATVRDARRPVRYIGRGGSYHTPEQMAAYLALPVRTQWNGEQTIGSFRDHLKGMGAPPWPAELERLRFDYFHGELVDPTHPGLDALAKLGRNLEAYGVPVVGVWSQPPLERGEMHFPGEFEKHVRADLALQESALSRHTSSPMSLLDVDLDDEDFEDSQNANEHYSYTGRVKVADAIAEAVRAR